MVKLIINGNTNVRVSNCVTRFLKQFEAERIETMEIGNLITTVEEGNRSLALCAPS